LLFLFVAEDRDLLLNPQADDAVRDTYINYYSTQRLRRMAEKFKGTQHADLFEGLRLVMRLLSGEQNGAGQALGLIPLGSFLFSDRAVEAVIDCQISNQQLLNAVRVLSLTYDDSAKVYRSIDYKNLGPEELGSVYESLLELHPRINIPAKQFVLATAGGNERKTTGSYYTPTSLINALLDSALNPVLDEAIKPSPQTPLPQGEGLTAEERILNLKICDPACGSGHFLIAAANRIAKALAFVRTGEEEPTPSAIQEAKRDVISHCIYGVDINPMAVELCKVNLWMEALEPGKPLSFLDHRIQVGNSLLGTTPKLMADGIPNEAFKAIEGDDKKFVSQMKRVNREERKQRESGIRQMSLFEAPRTADYGYLTDAMYKLDATPDDTLAGVRHKEEQYAQLANDPEYIKARLLADAWCSAFVWEKIQSNDFPLPMTDLIYRRMEADPLTDNLQDIREQVVRLTDRYGFFHWHIAFPDVFSVPDDVNQAENEQIGWNSGFDCILGNPPWERIKIQEKEWFAERVPDIASAPNASARRKMIKDLAKTDPATYADFRADKRKAEGESHFVRTSQRYPLCGRGDVNTYTIFSETSRHVINGAGRVGIIVPSGIATDDTTKFFFQDIMQTRSLVSLFDFENAQGIFAGVHRSYKFCLLTLTSWDAIAPQSDFVFFAHAVSDIHDNWRRFTLSAEDIAMLNPNTGTMATFRSVKDAEITKAIYRHTPVLIEEDNDLNPWGISFLRMFDMSNDSHLFRTFDELEAQGYTLDGNHFVKGESRYLPLYEAKMMHQFTHRWATYDSYLGVAKLDYSILQPSSDIKKMVSRDMTVSELKEPDAFVMPRYWVDNQEIIERIQDISWLLGFRDIARSTDERTALFAIEPRFGSGNTLILVFMDQIAELRCSYIASMNSFIVDYVVRQKVSGTHLTYNFVKQFPVIPPHTYTQALLDFIVPRVLELTYTAWDLQAFAQDVGWHGAPFVWDEERRFLMRCELDAMYFHLYGIGREDVDYIMETFPIVKRKDMARTKPNALTLNPSPSGRGTSQNADSSLLNEGEGRGDEGNTGEYITKRIILEMYDQMAELPMMGVPAPKDENSTYNVPDVSQWQTWLNPPPASPDVAHEDERDMRG